MASLKEVLLSVEEGLQLISEGLSLRGFIIEKAFFILFSFSRHSHGVVVFDDKFSAHTARCL